MVTATDTNMVTSTVTGTATDTNSVTDTYTQGRIQEFILGGGGGPNQGPQSKVKGEARIEGAKRLSIEGKARVEGAKRPRIEGEARIEGKAREKAGGRGLGRGLGEPLPRKFSKNHT